MVTKFDSSSSWSDQVLVHTSNPAKQVSLMP